MIRYPSRLIIHLPYLMYLTSAVGNVLPEHSYIDTLTLPVAHDAHLCAHLADLFDDEQLSTTTITIRARAGAVADVLELVGRTAGLNIVIDSTVTGVIGAVHFVDQTPGTILRALCQHNDPPLALRKFDTTWHVTPYDEVQKKIACANTALTTNVFNMKHVQCCPAFTSKVYEFWHQLTKNVDKAQCYCTIDADTKKVFVHGPLNIVNDMGHFFDEVDCHIPQVRIDALVAVADSFFEHSVGINWGGIYNRQASICRGFDFVGLGGKLTDFDAPKDGVNPLQFAFNLFTKGANAVKLPFVFGGPDLDTRRLNIQLNAAELDSHLRVLLRPSVLTSNNEPAEILIGKSIPISTLVQDHIDGHAQTVQSVNYKDVGTILNVRPVVCPRGESVLLDILVEDSATADHVDPTIPPVIKTIRTKNKVLLRSGQTTVIGGLMLNRDDVCQNRVPLLGRIPLLGRLFCAKRKIREDNELLIFITPTIV